jgi:hypothetical protein
MSKFITPVFRTSFVQVFEPRKAPGADKAKYSVTALYTDDPEVFPGCATIPDLKKAALEAAYEEFGNTDATKKRIKEGKIKMPFLENDEGKYPEEYVLVMRYNSDERFKPGVVDRIKGADGKPRPITEPDEFYSGCYAIASVRPFAYDTNGNKGVTFALNHAMKIRDGERLDGRVSAEMTFAGIEMEDEGLDGDDLTSMLDE